MPLLFGILVAAAVIFAIFAVTIGHGGSMTQFRPDWPGRPLPEDRTVRAHDLADAQFSLAFRGYRMAEVDDALDRLAVEIAQRDEQIERLTGQPFESLRPPEPEPVTPDVVTHEPPSAEQPSAEQPSAEQPSAEQPSAEQPPVPDYAAPEYAAQAPEYSAPDYSAPEYSAPEYSAPVASVPEYSTPTPEGSGPPTQPIPPVIEPGAER